MVEILGAEMPNIAMPSFGIGSGLIIWVLVAFAILVTGGIILYLIYDNRLFKYKIILFENIAGQGFQVVFKDRARMIQLGDGGEEILYLKKKKVYRTAYGKKMAKNTYWFVVGQDGYWYNSVLGDLDAKMGMLDIEPIDRDMRYMHVAVRKNIQDRYRKQKFMEKYGTIVMSGVFLLIMLIGIWFLLDKIGSIAGTAAGAMDAATKVAHTNEQVLSALENILSASGIKST